MALALDGSAHPAAGSGTSHQVTLTTTAAGVIIVATEYNDAFARVSSVTATGLTFFARGIAGPMDGSNPIETWYAVSSGAQTSLVITINYSASTSFCTATAFGVSDCDTSIIFDGNAFCSGGLPNSDPISINTTNADTFIFGCFRVNAASPTAGAAFTLITGADFLLVEYKIVSAAQSALSVDITTGLNQANGGIADAIILAGAAAPATKIKSVAVGPQAANNTSPATVTLPTGHAAGDTLLMFCSQASAAAVTFTPPAGWTSIARNSDATRAMTIEVYAKIDNGAESNPSVATSAATAGWTAQIGAWRNVDDGVISDAAAVLSNAAAAATFLPTGITTVTPYAWVISFVCSKDDNALNFNTRNAYLNRMNGATYDTTVGSGSDQAIGVADQEFVSPGAKTCPTWNESALGNDAWVGLTLALRPKTLVWGGRPEGNIGQGYMGQLLAT